jgi:zinc ribbon protein
MNCHKCGLQTLPDQRFCRSCGASLQTNTPPLVEHATVFDLERRPANILKDEKQRASGLMLWGFIIMFIGVAVGIIGKKLMHEDLVTVVGALVSITGMFLTVYPYLLLPPAKVDSRPHSQPDMLSQSQPGKYLPPENNIEYVPSITERTTSLLENSAIATRKQKEDGESQS